MNIRTLLLIRANCGALVSWCSPNDISSSAASHSLALFVDGGFELWCEVKLKLLDLGLVPRRLAHKPALYFCFLSLALVAEHLFALLIQCRLVHLP